jgi:hypothetical protein
VALTKRVEILFDPQQYVLMERIARARGETMGALVRRAVELQYLQPTWQQRRAAVRGILAEASDVTWEEARHILETDVGRRLEAP